MSSLSKKQLRFHSALFNLLFLGVIALLAWFSTLYSSSFDWTYNSRNSLSEASIELVKKMDGPISLNVYLQDEHPARAAIDELLKRYQRFKPDFNFHFYNPDLDIDLARVDNITRYGQVVLKYNQRKELLDNINEPLLTNALSRLSRAQTPLALFIDNHGERNPRDSSNIGYSLLAQELSEKGFHIDTHNLLDGKIPADTKIIIIAGANHSFLAGETEQLKQYIKQGGNLLWLHDPDSKEGLEGLAAELGIHFENGTLVDADPTLRATLRIQHPAMIAVLEYNLHEITKKIPYNTLFMLAGGVDVIESDSNPWQSTVLFNSRRSTWSETGGLLGKQIDFNKDKGDKLGPLPMAQALERSVTINEQEKRQRVVIVGDSDFLANSYLGAGANKILGANIFNWLSEDDQLISFELKNAPDLRLDLSDSQVTIIGLGFLVVLPVGLLMTGVIIWRRRKRQ